MIVKHPETGTVEFVLDFDTTETPYVVGSWDNWAAAGIAMVRDSDGKGTWRLALKLPLGDHQFRYRIGDQWFNDSSADHYVANGLGSENGVITVVRASRIAGLLAPPKKSSPPRVSPPRGRRRGHRVRELQH